MLDLYLLQSSKTDFHPKKKQECDGGERGNEGEGYRTK